MDNQPLIRFRIFSFKAGNHVADFYGDEATAFNTCILWYLQSRKRISYYYAPVTHK